MNQDQCRSLLVELFQWLGEKIPQFSDSLNRPATLGELHEVEENLSIKFPISLRNMYLLHNGQKDDSLPGPFYGLSFLSLERLQYKWEVSSKYADELSKNDLKEASIFCSSNREGFVKPLRYNRNWIPFSDDFGGNYLGVDLDPDYNGSIGQVINYGRDEDVKYVLGHSLDAFLIWYLDQLKQGNYIISHYPDSISSSYSFNTKYPQTGHFLDSIKEMF